MKSSKSRSTKSSKTNQAVIYARVSSKDQEKEGYSIPAQLKLLRQYAKDNGFRVMQEYVDVETAKQAGRLYFGEMTKYLEANPDIKTILVEKTDRLYRNFKDYVIIDDLGVEIHFCKEGSILSKDSKSAAKFLHGIKLLMAKNYIDNLSEEIKKGQLEKVEQGIWTSIAPLGYQNTTNSEGRKIIEPDPEYRSRIVELFELYASGKYSLKELAKKVRREGFVYRKTGRLVSTNTVRKILRNKIYAGSFIWGERMYRGIHEPLISEELWEKVQRIMDERVTTKHRRAKHDFAYSKLMTCVSCGFSVVGDVRKKKYLYYHCSGFSIQTRNTRRPCRKKFLREEAVEQQFIELLEQLRLDNDLLDWMLSELRSDANDLQLKREEARKRLQTELDRIKSNTQEMYLDKLNGRITGNLYDEMAEKFQREKERIEKEIEGLGQSDECFLEDGAQIIKLAANAHSILLRQNPGEKRQLLKFLLSNSTWDNGEIKVEWRNPLALLVKMNSEISSLPKNGRDFSKIDIASSAAGSNFQSRTALRWNRLWHTNRRGHSR